MITRHGVFLTFSLLLLVPSSGFAQSTADLHGETLIRALLDEMRLLRSTLQKNAAADVRARTLLERLRLQQEIVRELNREVEQRQTEAEMRMDHEPFEEMAANAEQRMKDATDPATKAQAEREMAGLKRRREMEQRNRARMETRFRRQEARLEEETARLRGIEDELRRLEQTLAPPSDPKL